MTRDRRDALVVRFDVPRGPDVCDRRLRLRFEPRSDGHWDKFTEQYLGDGWRSVGHEVVARVAVTEARESEVSAP